MGAAVEVECARTRTDFDDPSFLAGKFVVWCARERKGPLDVINAAPVIEDAGDGEYIYAVACRSGQRPTVRWRRPRQTEWSTGVPPETEE